MPGRWTGQKWYGSRQAAAALALLAGCLVTDKVEYDQTNYPPHVVPLKPSDNFTRVPDDPDSVACGDFPIHDDNTPWMAFIVDISDPNIEDSLQSRLVINGSIAAAKKVPPTGKLARERLVLCAKRGELTKPCNRVEILVTSHFSFQGAPYETDVEGDRGEWQWWVLGNAAETPDAKPSDCAAVLPDGGLP